MIRISLERDANAFFQLFQSDKFNPLPDIPILGSSNSTSNKYMISKIWTNGDTII